MTSALLVIDIQNDYFPGGKMELVGSNEAAIQAAKVQQKFRELGNAVINIQHIAVKPDSTFFLPNTSGAEIHAMLAPAAGEPLIIKHFPNAFRETHLLETLRNLAITDLTVVGMMTHMCVDTTVRAANDAGYNVTLVGDACATRDLEFEGTRVAAADVQAAYLAAIEGSFAKVVSADSILSSR